jgi:glucose-6-phosphate 1-dehydrogenase
MNNILILGSTSNICKIRVFNNLNSIHHLINKIYCFCNKNLTTKKFVNYINNSVTINRANMINYKINYINGEYNLDSYITNLSHILKSNTIIYVSTPPICYNDIIDFIKLSKVDCKLILEKPLSLNLAEFKLLKPKLNKNISMIDHFLYKNCIVNCRAPS